MEDIKHIAGIRHIDLSHYSEDKPHRKKQLLWRVVNMTLFRWLALPCFNPLRIKLLRLFGAQVSSTANVYASCKIWAPWNLQLGDYSCLAPHVEVYNKDMVKIADNVVISQGSQLCTASHDITKTTNPLITAPIKIEHSVWVAAGCFIGKGTTLGEGAVIGARACVFSDIEAWTVVGGNPARYIKKRILKGDS